MLGGDGSGGGGGGGSGGAGEGVGVGCGGNVGGVLALVLAAVGVLVLAHKLRVKSSLVTESEGPDQIPIGDPFCCVRSSNIPSSRIEPSHVFNHQADLKFALSDYSMALAAGAFAPSLAHAWY